MQYDQRVLRPHSAPKPTLNQITLLSLVIVVRLCLRLRLVIVFFLRLSSERTYIYEKSHDDKLARVISKTLRLRALKLERFFPW